jgi:hypothetical protein
VSSPSERLIILERLEKGEINADEAAKLLSGDALAALYATRNPMEILDMVDRGDINAEEAAKRIESLRAAPEPVVQRVPPQERAASVTVFDPVGGKERFSTGRVWGWWAIPLGIGVLLTILSGMWMNNSMADGNPGLAFFCAWLPLTIGILLMVIGWASRQGPWVHVNVKSRSHSDRSRVRVDVPVPIGIVNPFFKLFGDHIPGLDRDILDKIMAALEQGRRDGAPFHVRAQDGDDVVDITID